MSQSDPVHHLRLGTRGSLLAKSQSSWVARELERLNPGLRVELVIVQTSGDRITDQPLHAFGGKGLFTKELEQALLSKTVDFAVHSFKDVPVTMPLVDTTDLVIAAVPPREDPRDCWVSLKSTSLAELPAGAKVGTGSLRRRCQILDRRPDVLVEPIRGNIDTRLRKLREGQYDAVVLATAGLKRAGLFDASMMTPIEIDQMLPAPGQGALALQCRREDQACRGVLQRLHDETTATCVHSERAIVLGLNGDCHSPIAAYATLGETGDAVVAEATTPRRGLTLLAVIGGRDGEPPVLTGEARGPVNARNPPVVQLLDSLRERGAKELLHGSC